ncbi:MAG: DUF1700 domain-containing protein [Lachnospiraceae bacterium]|nr:DUF1700 domain-containing protein [Lachnospiraceae bacterium]
MMDRVTFMRELEQLLSELPPEERSEALSFFEEYFDTAGPEGEAEVIERLGSPRQAARRIIKDLKDDGADGEYTEAGYTEAADQERYQRPMERRMPKKWKLDRRSTLVLVIIAVVFCSPLITGIGGGLLGLGIGILTFLCTLVLGTSISGAALVITGVGLVIYGSVKMAAYAGSGLLIIGSGFFCMAAGMLLFILFTLVAFRFLPSLWQYVRRFFEALSGMWKRFRKKGERV